VADSGGFGFTASEIVDTTAASMPGIQFAASLPERHGRRAGAAEPRGFFRLPQLVRPCLPFLSPAMNQSLLTSGVVPGLGGFPRRLQFRQQRRQLVPLFFALFDVSRDVVPQDHR
jgi:hypothetical protein